MGQVGEAFRMIAVFADDVVWPDVDWTGARSDRFVAARAETRRVVGCVVVTEERVAFSDVRVFGHISSRAVTALRKSSWFGWV